MCFGWYQELLTEACVDDLATAEQKLLEMLDHGGMIVHVYRETDAENPELVGRHGRLRAFIAASDGDALRREAPLPHEVERFLLDSACLDTWIQARKTNELLDQHWSVIDLWPIDGQDRSSIYGKAMLVTEFENFQGKRRLSA